MTGRLDDVTASSDDVTLGPLTGDVRVELRGVPVAGDAAADEGTASCGSTRAAACAPLADSDFPSGT